MKINENMRQQYICPFCNYDCKEFYHDFKTTLFDCPNCHDFVIGTFVPSKTIFDVITDNERKLLATYFAKLPITHNDRREPITINNYKTFIEKAKKQQAL